ncbi:RNA 2',3'-cyclic phosphodiesterase [Alteribacter lacisalsi]|uniref:RNA 2',3'-cyclic phosphodiesterase n=1 Tax=Alteribacter lacisalsi TaxID=2045244 RepID=UPI00137535EC|nr:RNA 2',3'-cyclic phosphodiesterase [Alteribacter lacisalsi]
MSEDHYFIAFPVPEKVHEPLIRVQQTYGTGEKFKNETDREDFHITLLFFGGWDNEKRERLWAELKAKIAEEPAFSLSLREVGFFGRPAEPRVLFGGLKYSKTLMAVQKKISGLAEKHGFPVESRPYTPHITLAKGYKADKPLKLQHLDSDLPGIEWNVDEVILYKIHPSRRPKYEKIDTITLVR